MNVGRTIFAQLAEQLPHKEFQKCVARYRGDSNPRGFACRDQYLATVFAQLTYRESLRDIEARLRALGPKLYRMGFGGKVARSTLADANDAHDWRIYADFAHVLIAIARPLYAAEPMGVELEQSLYALDSTTIDLCLSLFPWARFRKHKAAVKMHTLLDLRGNIPTFIHITDGKAHDVNILDEVAIEAGAFYVLGPRRQVLVAGVEGSVGHVASRSRLKRDVPLGLACSTRALSANLLGVLGRLACPTGP
jgi:hypothetical protein